MQGGGPVGFPRGWQLGVSRALEARGTWKRDRERERESTESTERALSARRAF